MSKIKQLFEDEYYLKPEDDRGDRLLTNQEQELWQMFLNFDSDLDS